ncbi:MAG: cold shock domain-containing protein [Bacteroidota bacterium]
MNKSSDKEVLDFCRAKKIFDKGFGFLTSLYHKENVFFHFSKIKDEKKRELLSNLKRGVVSVFFTSKFANGKRKVDKVWLNAEEIPIHLLPDFTDRLTLELNNGNTNPFEIMDALNQLRKIYKLTEENYRAIICSSKIKRNPSILLKLISENELPLKNDLTVILEEWNNEYPSKIQHDDILISKLTKDH